MRVYGAGAAMLLAALSVSQVMAAEKGEVATSGGGAQAHSKPTAAKVIARVETDQTKTSVSSSSESSEQKVAATEAAGTEAPSTSVTEEKPTKPVVKAKPKKVAPSLVASVNLSTQRMTVSVNGSVRHVFKISSGRAGYRTPTGTYRPQWLARMHYSRKYNNAPMPYSVFYHRGYAIHATYATKRLGRPASHGCIRLSPSNAKTFYRLVQKHGRSRTRISLHGVAPRSRAVATARKRAKRVKYAYAQPNGFWQSSKPKRRVKTRYKKPSPSLWAPSGTTYRWPGD